MVGAVSDQVQVRSVIGRARCKGIKTGESYSSNGAALLCHFLACARKCTAGQTSKNGKITGMEDS